MPSDLDQCDSAVGVLPSSARQALQDVGFVVIPGPIQRDHLGSLHPAINRSVYEAGCETPVFNAGPLTFGIIICNDSNFPQPASRIAALGARILFVPTNNGLAPAKGGRELVARTREVDIARATENNIWVIRADVAGQAGELVSYGSSEIVDPCGLVVRSASELKEDLLMIEIESSWPSGRSAA